MSGGDLAALSRTPAELAALAQRAGEHGLDREERGEWSIRTTLAHLRDEEALVFRLRLERMLSEDRPLFVPFPPERWLAGRKRDRDGLRELLADFALQRKASLNLLERLRAEEWRREGEHPRMGAITVAGWVEYWRGHDEEHLGAIRRVLEALGR